MKRIFRVMVRKSDGTNVSETVTCTATSSLTTDKGTCEAAVQDAYEGSEVYSSSFVENVDREV